MKAKQLWQLALGELQQQVSKPNFDTWVKPVAAISFNDGALVLAAPNRFAREWLESRFMPQIKAAVGHVAGSAISVTLQTADHNPRGRKRELADSPDSEASPGLSSVGVRESSQPPVADSPSEPAPPTSLWNREWLPNSRYTFDSFVVGGSNEMAFAKARAVAHAPGTENNPLFIYGMAGLGKTHLLHAIAHAAMEADLKVRYITSEQFTNELVHSIRERRTQEFRERYRRLHLLLVDDIQFIAGKDSTQEEFFHTFNTLYEAGGHVVMSSDKPPKYISQLEERLRSRFEWGLPVEISPPDFETRMAILSKKASDRRTPIPPQVQEFVAHRVQRNVRELEGALNRIVARAEVQKRPITVELAATALSDLINSPLRRFLSPVQVVEVTAKFYRLDLRDLKSKKRDRALVLARQVAMYLLREETDASLVEIGRELGGRDHTTVLHGCEKIRSAINADDALRRDVLAIRETLFGQVPRV